MKTTLLVSNFKRAEKSIKHCKACGRVISDRGRPNKTGLCSHCHYIMSSRILSIKGETEKKREARILLGVLV